MISILKLSNVDSGNLLMSGHVDLFVLIWGVRCPFWCRLKDGHENAFSYLSCPCSWLSFMCYTLMKLPNYCTHSPVRCCSLLTAVFIGILCPYKGHCEHQPFILVPFSFLGNDSRYDFWPLDGGRGPVSLGPWRKTIILWPIKKENRGKMFFFLNRIEMFPSLN